MAAPLEWIDAVKTQDLAPGEAMKVDVTPPIAVFNCDGEFFATEDTCPHAVSSLSEDGYLDGDVVECGYHFAKFNVRSGALLSPPASRPLCTFPVRVVDGIVQVGLDAG